MLVDENGWTRGSRLGASDVGSGVPAPHPTSTSAMTARQTRGVRLPWAARVEARDRSGRTFIGAVHTPRGSKPLAGCPDGCADGGTNCGLLVEPTKTRECEKKQL